MSTERVSSKTPEVLKAEQFLGRVYEDVDKSRYLVGDNLFHRSRAEFYYDTDFRKLRVDCWIDSLDRGGQDIGRWDESAVTPRGRKAVVDTIKRLVRNFDPV